MLTRPEVIDLHPAAHPAPDIRRAGFLLDHPYIEQCWGPLIGPSSVSFLRHCVWHWQDERPARLSTADLAAELGLGRGVGPNSVLWRTIGRLEHFRFARHEPYGAGLEVFTRVPPVTPDRLSRLPQWVRGRHVRLNGERLEAVGRQIDGDPPVQARMAARLDHMARNPTPNNASLTR